MGGTIQEDFRVDESDANSQVIMQTFDNYGNSPPKKYVKWWRPMVYNEDEMRYDVETGEVEDDVGVAFLRRV